MNLLETYRTYMRRPQLADIELMRELDGDALVVQYTPMRIPQTEEQTKIRLMSQVEKQNDLEPYGVWLAHLKSDDSFLGWFMLMPTATNSGPVVTELEIGFMIVRKYWNHGLTTEVARCLIEYAKNLKTVKTMIARTDLKNLASIHTVEKLGFQYVETRLVPERNFPGESQIKFFSLTL